MSEAAFAAFAAVEALGRLPDHGGIARHDHLGDAVAVVDGKGFLREVDQDYAYFAAVVGVDGTGLCRA